jgi:hypothetical protein
MLLASNRMVVPLLAGAAPVLLQPPINVLRLSLHPSGLAPRIVNLPEWRAHLLERLRQQIAASADPVLEQLHKELCGYPAPPETSQRGASPDYAGVAVPLQLATEAGVLSFLSTTTVFGTPVDVTLSELALETFFPLNDFTADAVRQIAAAS